MTLSPRDRRALVVGCYYMAAISAGCVVGATIALAFNLRPVEWWEATYWFAAGLWIINARAIARSPA